MRVEQIVSLLPNLEKTQSLFDQEVAGIESQRELAAKRIRDSIGQLVAPIKSQLPESIAISCENNSPGGYKGSYYHVVEYEAGQNELYYAGRQFWQHAEDGRGESLGVYPLEKPFTAWRRPMGYNGWIDYYPQLIQALIRAAKLISRGDPVLSTTDYTPASQDFEPDSPLFQI